MSMRRGLSASYDFTRVSKGFREFQKWFQRWFQRVSEMVSEVISEVVSYSFKGYF